MNREREHDHEHTHADGTTHSHPHSHEGEHRHEHGGQSAPRDAAAPPGKHTAPGLPPEPTQQGDGQEAGTARPRRPDDQDR